MKRRKALLSEEGLLVGKETRSAKRVRELLKHVSRLCTGKNRTKHIWQAVGPGGEPVPLSMTQALEGWLSAGGYQEVIPCGEAYTCPRPTAEVCSHSTWPPGPAL